jgi:hypothetical protein
MPQFKKAGQKDRKGCLPASVYKFCPGLFDDYKCDDYFDCDCERLLKRDKFLLNKTLPKTGLYNYSFT